jgi:hypothetical protein
MPSASVRITNAEKPRLRERFRQANRRSMAGAAARILPQEGPTQRPPIVTDAASSVQPRDRVFGYGQAGGVTAGRLRCSMLTRIIVGIVFAVPTTHVQVWRLAAWMVSAIGYATHIADERFRLRNSPGSAALHVALAVALGAFGLAVGAKMDSLFVGSTPSTGSFCFSRSGSGRS